MRSRFVAALPDIVFEKFSCSKVFIADFSNRTSKTRGVEIADYIWKCPKDPNKDMDVLTVHNEGGHNITFSIFHDNSFKKEDGVKVDSHTEGAFFIDKDDETFVALYEIKDCKLKQMSKYKIGVKNKIIRTTIQLREKGIISMAKVIEAYISFPRKTSFNGYLFNDNIEMKKFLVDYKVNAYATNDICVRSNSVSVPYE